ncbi:hypothetical protein PISMIDRAFT_629798 [Pisolithus microcarpus 441]|uniref:Uncharacterized protein n=1 Tax=Pisolithus microcarpus 441 TaxID=765257 RepID=A0A0C9ZGK7_9AGAM|nr:hypothetical protein PISMIDRAFT_629798 [Pisolithus microcarpus 441]
MQWSWACSIHSPRISSTFAAMSLASRLPLVNHWLINACSSLSLIHICRSFVLSTSILTISSIMTSSHTISRWVLGDKATKPIPLALASQLGSVTPGLTHLSHIGRTRTLLGLHVTL